MKDHSLLRRCEHEALAGVTLSGMVLDLGGEKDAEYLAHLRGTFSVTCVNLDPGARPDVMHDLEKPLPFADASYDHVLLINVLEHIYDYRALLDEAFRALKPGGKLVVMVPFLFPIHPSPNDYWRFTAPALEKLLAERGIAAKVTPLGSGVFSARHLLLNRLLPGALRRVSSALGRPLATVTDRGFTALARHLGKRYVPAEYPLGYLAVAHKP